MLAFPLIRHCAAQARRARHGRVLVQVGRDCGGGGFFHKGGAGEVGKALAKIDGIVLQRQRAHFSENRGAEAGHAPGGRSGHWGLLVVIETVLKQNHPQITQIAQIEFDMKISASLALQSFRKQEIGLK